MLMVPLYESSPGSFDECRLSARWPPTLRPSQPTWAVSLPVGCYHPHPPSPFIIITRLESWCSLNSLTVGGRLSRPRHCSKGVQTVPMAVYRSGCHDKHNWLWWDSNLDHLIPQSNTLPLDHCDHCMQRMSVIENSNCQHIYWRNKGNGFEIRLCPLLCLGWRPSIFVKYDNVWNSVASSPKILHTFKPRFHVKNFKIKLF